MVAGDPLGVAGTLVVVGPLVVFEQAENQIRVESAMNNSGLRCRISVLRLLAFRWLERVVGAPVVNGRAPRMRFARRGKWRTTRPTGRKIRKKTGFITITNRIKDTTIAAVTSLSRGF